MLKKTKIYVKLYCTHIHHIIMRNGFISYELHAELNHMCWNSRISLCVFQIFLKKSTVKYLFRPRSQNTINVNQLLHLFPVKFSEEGSNRRAREEEAYREFIRYAREVYGKDHYTVYIVGFINIKQW